MPEWFVRLPGMVKLAVGAAWFVGLSGMCAILTGSAELFLEALAFFAGFLGIGVMFFRWRVHGDRLAGVWCLFAFGAWVVGGFMGAGEGDRGLFSRPADWVTASALLIGLAGGVVTLIRARRGKSESGE